VGALREEVFGSDIRLPAERSMHTFSSFLWRFVACTSVATAAGCGRTSSSGSETVAVTIQPLTVQLSPGGTEGFTAIVTGLANTGVLWTVSEGLDAGIITSNGLYTAPASPGTYHVLATAQADASKSAAAAVTVTSSASDPTVCSRIVPESVAPSIDCTPLPLASGVYDGCSISNTPCGPVYGCLLERNETVGSVVATTYSPSVTGYTPPQTTLFGSAPPMGTVVTGKGSGWFGRGDGTLATGSCAFPPVNDIMVAALTSQQFGNADWCGACAEVVGRSGERVRVEIVDQCTGCAPGGLDLASGADSPYEMLNLPGNPDVCRDGLQPISWKLVPCEASGGIVIHYVAGYNRYTPAVQIRNHRLPIVKLEDYYNGVWNERQRTADNKYFLVTRDGTALPLTLRVTAVDGATITGTFPAFVPDDNYEASSQF